MNKRDIQVLQNMSKRIDKMIDKERDEDILWNLLQANGYINEILFVVVE